jgi:hypothetical protein
VFDELNHKLVRRAQSEAIAGGNREAKIKEFIQIMLKDMTQKGILNKPLK